MIINIRRNPQIIPTQIITVLNKFNYMFDGIHNCHGSTQLDIPANEFVIRLIKVR